MKFSASYRMYQNFLHHSRISVTMYSMSRWDGSFFFKAILIHHYQNRLKPHTVEQNYRYFYPVILALCIVYQEPVTVMVEQKEIEDLLGFIK